jgi:hypothetical protein
VNPSKIALPFPFVTEAHHPSLVVLEVALQAAISALYCAHPTLEHDGELPPYDHQASNDEILAQILVVSSGALLDLLRHYRAVQDEEADF